MEKPKRKGKDKEGEGQAEIEFVAPYSLSDCLFRIRDTKQQDTSFMSAGIDPSFERVNPGLYRFKIRRTWYDNRYRRHSSTVELRGYLKALDETSTVVLASLHTGWQSRLVYGMFIIFLPLTILATWMEGGGKGAFMILGIVLILVIFGGIQWADKRTLRYVIYKAMSDDLL